VLSENVKRFSGDNVIFLAGHKSCGCHHLSFGEGRNLFAEHATKFVLAVRAAGCESQHAKRNDTLRVQSKLKRLQSQCEPRVEHSNFR